MTQGSHDSLLAILKRVFGLLSASERNRSGLLLFSIIANSIVEILGLAVIVPVIGLVIQPEAIETNTQLRKAYSWTHSFGIDSAKEFLILLCAGMISAFLIKALFGLVVNLYQSRFAFSVAHRLSGEMWSYHFAKSLERMRSSATGRILAEINGWPISFAQIFLVGGLLILNEITVISLIAIGLMAYNAMVFVSIAALLGLGALLIRSLTKARLSKYSQVRKRLEPHTNTLITNAVRGFLEVIAFQATNAVKNAYLRDRWTIFRINSNITVLNLMPSKLYEVLAVLAIACSIVIALLQGTPQDGFLQLLTFMAISAYRVMPSMSRLNGAAMQMRAQIHVLETMEAGHELACENTHESINSKEASANRINIELREVELRYEALELPVVTALSDTFQAGKVNGIVGPSGSGKSTLVSALLGIHPIASGSFLLQTDNQPVVPFLPTKEMNKWIQNVSYLSQQPFLFQGTLEENLTLRVDDVQLDEPKVLSLIESLELTDVLGDDPLSFELHEGGTNLSGGQQQRIALLRALQHQRPLVLLDEATSALDPRLSKVVFDLLRERAREGCNVILVTHDPTLESECDHVVNLGDLGSQNQAENA